MNATMKIPTNARKNLIAGAAIALAWGSASFAYAAGEAPTGELTLDQAITEGLQNSPEIQRAEAAADETHWRKNETLGGGFLPRVNVQLSHYFDVTKYQLTDINFGGNEVTIPGIFPNNQIALNATLPIFDGLANVYRLEAASLADSAAEQDLDRLRFAHSQQIRLAFYQSLAADALKEAATENVKTLQDHLKQVQIQRSGGTATQYDMLRVQVQLSEGQAAEDDAEDNVLQSHRRLAQLLGLSADQRTLKGELPVPDTTKVKDLALGDQTPAERSDLRALQMRAEAADKERKAQGAWFIPSISAGGQYSYYNLLLYNNGIYDNHNYQTAYNLGVFLTWNLFDGGVSYARSRESAARRIQAEKTSTQAAIQVPYDFAYWKQRYVSNTNRFASKQLDVTRSVESVRLAKVEERAGSRTSTEVLDAELDLFRSRAGVVNAQVNAAESLINLELALGRKI